MNEPLPFNPEYRAGFGPALEKEYVAWCDAHPDSTQEDRILAHREIAHRLAPLFPSVKELSR